MRWNYFWGSLFLLVLLLGCTRPPAQLGNVFDPEVDFSQYTTWSWLDEQSDLADMLIGSEPVDRMIRRTVSAELTAKGMRQIPQESQLLVNYMTSLQDAVAMTTGPSGFSYGWRWSQTTSGEMQRDSLPRGTLLIEMIDRKKNQIVWQGKISGVVANVDEARTKIPEAVRQVLAQYPPSKK